MKKSPPADPVPEVVDWEARVREAAYFEYQRKGCVEGGALDDWLAAEDQLGAQAATARRGVARRPAARKDGGR